MGPVRGWKSADAAGRPSAELEVPTAKEVVDFASYTIPDDPLLKRLSALKPEEISEDDLEELDDRCTAQIEKWSEGDADKQQTKITPK